MHRQVVSLLLSLFLVVIAINSPGLPFNASRADLIFIPLAVSILALAGFRWSWRRADLAVALYLLGSLPALAVSAEPRASAVELIRQLYLAGIYFVVAIAVRQQFARAVGRGLAFGAVLLSAIGLIFVVLLMTGAWPLAPTIGEYMQLPYIGDTLRLRALTATPAMFACLLTVAVPFAIAFCREHARAWCAAAILMTTAVFFTFSHVIAGFAVAVLIATWPSLAARPTLRRLAVAAVAAVVIAFNLAATVSITSLAYGDSGFVDSTQYQYAVGQGEARIGGAAITYNVMSYARIKQVAWSTFLEHPIAGIGLDRFHEATARAYSEGRLTHSYREIDPHSTLPGRLAECGIIGGVTLLLLWAAWGAMARDVARTGPDWMLGYAGGAALAGLLVASINADIMNFRFLWVIAGLLRGLHERVSEQ
jgi:hypothetical protein